MSSLGSALVCLASMAPAKQLLSGDDADENEEKDDDPDCDKTDIIAIKIMTLII